MPGQMTPRQLLESGASHHQAGRLAEAEALYRQVLEQQPDHADALHLLGVLAGQKGQPGPAEDLIRRAIRIKPDLAQAHNNLGFLLVAQGQLDQAIASYRRAIEIAPDLADAHSNLGFALNVKGRFDEAIAAGRHALRINPKLVEAHINLGNALQGKGQLNDAIACYRQAIRLNPDLAQAHNNLGNALMSIGQLDEAIACHRQAIRLNPDLAEAHYNLGLALEGNAQFDEAIAATRQALRLKPDYAEAYVSLGNALGDIGQLEDAIAANRQALRFKPDYAKAYNNLGNLGDIGQLDDAIACYRQAIRLKPDYPIANSNLIFTMNFHPDCDSAAILREARQWDERHGKPLRHLIRPHNNSRDADRRLRIGYVSPDFRRHVVGWNLLPLLRQHDREHFEVFCYSSVTRPDAMTEQLRACSDQWREVAPLSDERLAEQIRADGIDVLIDLSLHTAGNRLRTFAMSPAPVQITYLGYCGTSGVEAMHYRFSDWQLDPPEQDLSCYSEQTLRLPETYWCYAPGGAAPEPSDLPAERNHHVTFGSMNQFAKVSSAAMDLWCEILKRTPLSRLLIHAPRGEYLSATRARFDRRGVAPDRVEFVDRQTWDPYMRTYHRIDIALDTFPYNGGITTCDALWMGVAVITLSGHTPVGRGGGSILHNVGLADLAAFSPEEYANLAVGLAGDIPRLSGLRKTLRPRMQASPLMDAPRFARNVEAAYRDAWRRWCASHSRRLSRKAIPIASVFGITFSAARRSRPPGCFCWRIQYCCRRATRAPAASPAPAQTAMR